MATGIKATLKGEEWRIVGVKASYRLALRYAKVTSCRTIGGLVNRALRQFLEAEYPQLLTQAEEEIERLGEYQANASED